MKPDEIRTRHPLGTLHGTARAAAVGMRGSVERLHQTVHGDRGRVVFVLTDERDHLAASGGDFSLGEQRVNQAFGEDAEYRPEVFDQARADQ